MNNFVKNFSFRQIKTRLYPIPNSTPKIKQSMTMTRHDPFGIYDAINDAKKPKSLRQIIIATGIRILLFSAVFIPPFILLFIIYFGIRSSWATPYVLLLFIFSLWVIGFIASQLRLFNLGMIRTTNDEGIEHELYENRRQKIAVIGAGPVGLAVTKECSQLGLDVTCFEAKDGIGGVFRYNENIPGGVWKSLILTSSPWVTAFSDFPPETLSSKHWSHDEYLDYLERYVDHFCIRDNILLNHKVINVKKLSHGWELYSLNRETKENITTKFDRIIVCNGVHSHQKTFDVPNIEAFQGEILSVGDYKTAERFCGKRVCIVGLGESGADLATEISSKAQKTYLSVKNGAFVIPRINPLNNLANDYDTNRIRYATPLALRNWYMLFRRRLCFWTNDLSDLAAIRAQLLMSSRLGPMSQKAVKQDEFVRPILDRKLTLCTEIHRFEADSIVCNDGSKHAVDTVIFTHGFQPKFDFLDEDVQKKISHPGNLYLNMFSLDYRDSIAFCGFARPTIGAIPPTGELQARLVALIASGQKCLPTNEEMLQDIKHSVKQNKISFPMQVQPNFVINWIPYMDKLATLIGCRPNPWQLLMRPRLFWKVGTGPVTGAIYRLNSETSMKTVMNLQRTHQLEELLSMMAIHFLFWPIGLFAKNSKFSSSNTFI